MIHEALIIHPVWNGSREGEKAEETPYTLTCTGPGMMQAGG